MAGTSLIALLDDIASVLDDVSVMSKLAAKKTAGVLGDDLALNAQQVTGVQAERELPVVWAVAKGSLLNKAILVPLALAISALAPWAVTPLLMVGGAFLCYEGFEKLAHRLLHSRAEDEAEHAKRLEALVRSDVDMCQVEKDKIKGAIRTDFILSAEIIAITLGTVADASFMMRLAVMSAIAVIMTVGVYGFVAGIVKMDDAGLYLTRKDSRSALGKAVGRGLLLVAPRLMQSLSVIGTIAMFLVGGGILAHGLPGAEELIHHVTDPLMHIAVVGGFLGVLGPVLLQALLGVIAGGIVLLVVTLVRRLLARPATAA